MLVGATLYVFVQLIGKPDYKTLYSGLNPGDAQDITASLAAKKIPFEQSPDGSQHPGARRQTRQRPAGGCLATHAAQRTAGL